jgi:hypothetical protein
MAFGIVETLDPRLAGFLVLAAGAFGFIAAIHLLIGGMRVLQGQSFRETPAEREALALQDAQDGDRDPSDRYW